MDTTNPIDTITRIRDEALEKIRLSSWGDSGLIARIKAIPINVNDRMRTNGGHCAYYVNRATGMSFAHEVTFSRAHMANCTEEEFRNTVSHEYAHAWHSMLRGKSDHGWEWMTIHRAMGGNGKRTHDIECEGNRVRRYVIKDLSTGRIYKAVSTRTWNRIKNVKIFDVMAGKSTAAYELLGMYYRGDKVPVVA